MGDFLHWRVHLLITEVPVTDSVEIKISHIVSLDYGLYLATHFNFSPAVVLLFKHVGAIFNCCCDVVGLITKSDLFHRLLTKRSYKKAIDLGHRIVVSDHSAIFEFNPTMA